MFSRSEIKAKQCRPKDLPSNGKISDELAKLVELLEDDKDQRLLALRETAVKVMRDLQEFSPRLIGSVSTERVRQGSDIDLHAFVDNIETLETALQHLQWFYKKEQITIKKRTRYVEYNHIYLEADFPVELSVYPRSALATVVATLYLPNRYLDQIEQTLTSPEWTLLPELQRRPLTKAEQLPN